MKKYRKYLVFNLVIVSLLAVTLFFGACTKAESTTTTTATTSEPLEVIELSFAHQSPPTAGGGIQYANWAKRIEEQTQGRVKITIYPASSLVGPMDQIDSLIGGICDIGQTNTLFNPQLVLHSLLLQPGLDLPPFEEYMAKTELWRALYEKFPEMRAEFKGFVPLFMFESTPNSLQFANRVEVRTPADLIGMRIGTGAQFLPVLDAWGATPIDNPFTDRYLSLDKGMIDGSFLSLATANMMKIPDVTKAITLNIGAVARENNFISMNEEVWNSLPPDIQKVFMDNWEPTVKEFIDSQLADEQQAIDVYEKAGDLVVTATAEEYKLWTNPLLPFLDKWAEAVDAKGLPGTAMLEEAQRILAGMK
ncbi:MAG: TRAP transporter substrate-binding protein DctP [Dehalococcoidales bacterium]|nr:TRAP transporter substrate-binding protein DctP [Dehalococcoidales bacterium]